MFVGDKDIIMTRGFHAENPYLLSKGVKETQEVSAAAGAVKIPGIKRFVDGVKAGKQIDGGFRQAWPITEAVNLYAAALRSGAPWCRQKVPPAHSPGRQDCRPQARRSRHHW